MIEGFGAGYASGRLAAPAAPRAVDRHAGAHRDRAELSGERARPALRRRVIPAGAGRAVVREHPDVDAARVVARVRRRPRPAARDDALRRVRVAQLREGPCLRERLRRAAGRSREREAPRLRTAAGSSTADGATDAKITTRYVTAVDAAAAHGGHRLRVAARLLVRDQRRDATTSATCARDAVDPRAAELQQQRTSARRRRSGRRRGRRPR